MSEFNVRIHLGNAAMKSPESVAAALRRTAEKVEAGFTGGSVIDGWGNVVGQFSLIGDYEEEAEDE